MECGLADRFVRHRRIGTRSICYRMVAAKRRINHGKHRRHGRRFQEGIQCIPSIPRLISIRISLAKQDPHRSWDRSDSPICGELNLWQSLFPQNVRIRHGYLKADRSCHQLGHAFMVTNEHHDSLTRGPKGRPDDSPGQRPGNTRKRSTSPNGATLVFVPPLQGSVPSIWHPQGAALGCHITGPLGLKPLHPSLFS